jgi:hypothetical protein
MSSLEPVQPVQTATELHVRLSRFSPILLLTFLLCYYTLLAHTSPFGRQGSAQPFKAVSEAFDTLHAAVLASPLARDTRPSPEEDRRAYVALWADLEPGARLDSRALASDSDQDAPVSAQP